MRTPRWQAGDVIVRREVLGLDPIPRAEPHPDWYGQAWAVMPVVVVEDSDERLVTYFAPGAQFVFPEAPGSPWPITGGIHPWDTGDRRWEGNGVLMIQRPGDHYAVWLFWDGEDRTFATWYVNLQTAFVRTELGYDTQDLELDLVVSPDGEVRYLVDYQDGRIVSVEGGGVDPGDGVGITTKYPDAKAVLTGDLDANALFMSGKAKVTGPTGQLLSYLSLTKTTGHESMRETLAAETEF